MNIAKKQIKAKILECLDAAREQFGSNLKYEDITIKFTTAGQAAGRASCRLQRLTRTAFDFGLMFQLEAYDLDSNEFLNRTVPHEVAHLVCYEQPHLGKSHNAGWVRVCRALGGSGARTHQEVLSKAKYKTQYLYRTDRGVEHKLGAVRHRKIQNGAVYIGRGNDRIAKEHFVRVISGDEHREHHQKKVAAHAASKGAEPKVPTRKPARKRMASSGTPSKLDRCRQVYIHGASRQSNIDAFVAVGCTTAGAATYYAKIKKEMA